jgi:hypothetical protein
VKSIFYHSTKSFEEILPVVVRSRFIRDAIRKQYGERAGKLIAELRKTAKTGGVQDQGVGR